MVVNDLNVETIAAIDRKANAKLIVDPNAELPFPVTVEPFQSISGRDAQILQTSCIVDHDQLSERDPLYVLWQLSGKGLVIDLFGFRISKALDHNAIIHALRVYVKQL